MGMSDEDAIPRTPGEMKPLRAVTADAGLLT